ncbi:hypothetical protein Agub_g6114, partial [Astrephomene gubernaculifera]
MLLSCCFSPRAKEPEYSKPGSSPQRSQPQVITQPEAPVLSRNSNNVKGILTAAFNRVSLSKPDDQHQNSTGAQSQHEPLLQLLPVLTSLEGGWWDQLERAVAAAAQHLAATHACIFLISGDATYAAPLALIGPPAPPLSVGVPLPLPPLPSGPATSSPGATAATAAAAAGRNTPGPGANSGHCSGGGGGAVGASSSLASCSSTGELGAAGAAAGVLPGRGEKGAGTGVLLPPPSCAAAALLAQQPHPDHPSRLLLLTDLPPSSSGLFSHLHHHHHQSHQQQQQHHHPQHQQGAPCNGIDSHASSAAGGAGGGGGGGRRWSQGGGGGGGAAALLPPEWSHLAAARGGGCSHFAAVAIPWGHVPLGVLSLGAEGPRRPPCWTPESLHCVAALLSAPLRTPQVDLACRALSELSAAVTVHQVVRVLLGAAEQLVGAVSRIDTQARVAFLLPDLDSAAVFRSAATDVVGPALRRRLSEVLLVDTTAAAAG